MKVNNVKSKEYQIAFVSHQNIERISPVPKAGGLVLKDLDDLIIAGLSCTPKPGCNNSMHSA